MSGRLHIVTGIPGTRVQKALEVLNTYSRQRNGGNIHIVSVERHLREIADPYVRENWSVPGSSLGLLLLPRPFLRQLWSQAFKQAWMEVETGLKSGNVLLTFHACYFHHLTREYFIPVDIDLLRELVKGRPTSLITLIDDIYDCHHHLFAAGGRFSAPKSFEEAILDLLNILDWRSKEILASDSLAYLCNLPHFVFAVKHPIETFFDLLYSSKKHIYISHPISEPRRLHRAGKIEEARTLVQKVTDVVTRLRTNYVVFEPTAIDELRLRAVDGKLMPCLDARWPFGNETRDLLYSPPTVGRNAFAFPAGWTVDNREDLPSSPLVQELFNAIMAQISGRDHKLVEQSQLLVCIRPLFEGNASRGVKEELRYLRLLIRLGVRAKEANAIVLNPKEDVLLYPLRQLMERMDKWKAGNVISGSLESLFGELRKSQPRELQGLLDGSGQALLDMCARHEIVVEPSGDEVLSEGAMGATTEVRRVHTANRLANELVQLKTTYLDELAQEGIVTIGPSEGWLFEKLGC